MSGYLCTICNDCGKPFAVMMAEYIGEEEGRQIEEYRRNGIKTSAVESFDRKWCECEKDESTL